MSGNGRTKSEWPGRIAVGWSLGGVALVFGFAVYRLLGRGFATLRTDLAPEEWLGLVILSALFLYGEGVVALQGKWVPEVFRRSEALTEESNPIFLALAPLVGMGLLSRSPKTLARAWIGTAAIVLAVLVVRRFPSPWRGITSFSVALALAWALGVILWRAPRALRS